MAAGQEFVEHRAARYRSEFAQGRGDAPSFILSMHPGGASRAHDRGAGSGRAGDSPGSAGSSTQAQKLRRMLSVTTSYMVAVMILSCFKNTRMVAVCSGGGYCGVRQYHTHTNMGCAKGRMVRRIKEANSKVSFRYSQTVRLNILRSFVHQPRTNLISNTWK